MTPSADADATAPLEINLLGPTIVRSDGNPKLLTRQDLQVLTALAYLSGDGALVEADLVEQYAWRVTPTPRALQSSVYRLRQVLGADAVLSRYRRVQLNHERIQLDTERFLTMTAEAAPGSHRSLQTALALVRGEPFETMSTHPLWVPIRDTWHARVQATEERLVTEHIRGGQLDDAVVLLRSLVVHDPSSIDNWTTLVRVLVRQGRRADALRVLDQARRASTQLGLDLDESLVTIEVDLLRVGQSLASAPTAGRLPVHAGDAEVVGLAEQVGMPPAALTSLVGADPRSLQDMALALFTGADARMTVRTCLDARLGELSAVARDVVQLAAVMGSPVRLSALPFALDLGNTDVRKAIDEAGASRLVDVGTDSLAVSHPVVRELLLDTLPGIEHTRLAERVLASELWCSELDGHVALVELSSVADLANGWRRACDHFISLGDHDSDVGFECMAELAQKVLRQLPPGAEVPVATRVKVLCRRSVALHSVGRFEEGRRAHSEAYRLALRSMDDDLIVHVIHTSAIAVLPTVTDEGDWSRALADQWVETPHTTDAHRARVDAVRALHLLARRDRQEGARVARRAIDTAHRVGDRELMWDVMVMVTNDLLADWSFEADAMEFAALSRAEGDVFHLVKALLYVFCGRMRRQETTFDDPIIHEIEMLLQASVGTSTWMRGALLRIARMVLAGDRAATEQVLASAAPVFGAQASPVLMSWFSMTVMLANEPDWSRVSPLSIVGDPAELRISSPVDVLLHRAAIAVDRGDVAGTVALLAGVQSSVYEAEGSPLVMFRLPRLALIARAAADATLAARLLDLHIGMSGTDLCMLPSLHLGPADSWLALLADVAGDDRASALHAAARARLVALGAGVLECADAANSHAV